MLELVDRSYRFGFYVAHSNHAYEPPTMRDPWCWVDFVVVFGFTSRLICFIPGVEGPDSFMRLIHFLCCLRAVRVMYFMKNGESRHNPHADDTWCLLPSLPHSILSPSLSLSLQV